MDVIRRNTDYALRLIVNLVENNGKGPLSARQLAQRSEVPYQLACKLLQKLSAAGLVKSSMGAGGGFELANRPGKISLYQVIETIQGGICLNRCISDAQSCPRKSRCLISKKLAFLQKHIENHLSDIKLEELLEHRGHLKK